MKRSLVPALLLVAAAACSRAGSSDLPLGPHVRQPFVRENGANGNVKVTIAIPTSTGPLRPHFVSPSTKSMKLDVYDKTHATLLATRTANVGMGSKGCMTTGSGLSCTETFSVPAGADAFDLTLYDATNATGKKLSALADFPQTVTAGQTATLSMVLGGIAKSIAIVGTPSGGLSGKNDANGFTIYGSAPQTFAIVPKDGDGNYIVGPGSPAVSWLSPANLHAVKKAGTNAWTVKSTYSATDPTVPWTGSIAVQATPVPNSGGTTVKLSVPLTLYQPWIYVMNEQGTGVNMITAYDEDGNQKKLAGTWKGLNHPTWGVYSPSNKRLYVTRYEGGVYVGDLMGHPQATSGTFSDTSAPGKPALDTINSWIYVPNSFASSDYVTAYDLDGHRQTLGSGAFNLPGAYGMVYDANLYALFGVSFSTATMARFDADGNTVPSGSFSGISGPRGLTVDTKTGNLYVASDRGSPAIDAFDSSGNAVALSGTFTGADDPTDIAYDPYNDRLYVVTLNYVEVYDPDGNWLSAGSGGFANLASAYGVVIVP